jgi:hypothetical protein
MESTWFLVKSLLVRGGPHLGSAVLQGLWRLHSEYRDEVMAAAAVGLQRSNFSSVRLVVRGCGVRSVSCCVALCRDV